MTSDCLSVTHNGKKLEYDGILIKRSTPGPDQFLLSGAGQTVSSTFDVSKGYDMSESGTYSVAVDTYLEYVVGSVKDMNVLGKPGVQTKISHLSSPAELFEVTENNPSRRTLGQTARSLEKEYRFPGNQFSRRMLERKSSFSKEKHVVSERQADNSSTLLGPMVRKGTKAQRKATRDVHQAAYDHIKSSISDLKNNQRRGKTWFGETHIDYAINIFKKMEEILRKDKITYVFGGKYCDNEKYAYTYTDTRKIFLCKNYEKARKLSGFDNKMGILTHELSHALAKTDDKVYGFSACKQLAKSAPRRASRNADNYEYFVETL